MQQAQHMLGKHQRKNCVNAIKNTKRSMSWQSGKLHIVIQMSAKWKFSKNNASNKTANADIKLGYTDAKQTRSHPEMAAICRM